MDTPATKDRLLVQIASYNTNLQGTAALPQNLVDWLSPVFQVSSFLSKENRNPDLVVVGFQELLPLPQGLSGFSKKVINEREKHILSQIEANARGKERYVLITKVVNAGVALLVYARDSGDIARTLCDVETAWTGCGPMYMGNKGAVGVRFRVPGLSNSPGNVFTFVNAHLTAHSPKLQHRLNDYSHIVGSLLFSPLPNSTKPTTMYSTSHLFFLGDLNFRVSIPPDHPLAHLLVDDNIANSLANAETRTRLKELDQLFVEKRKGHVCNSLREGEFWSFKCSYKYHVGEVDKYDLKRFPSWTDRILYTTHTDSPNTPDESGITNVLYTSVPSYTTSDHKPIVALLLLPPATASSALPLLQLPPGYNPIPDPRANLKRYTGRCIDRTVGIVWWLFTTIGAGSSLVGIFNFFIGIGAWRWWKWTAGASVASNV